MAGKETEEPLQLTTVYRVFLYVPGTILSVHELFLR